MNSGACPRDCGRILAAKATACASRNSWRHAWTPKATSAHFALAGNFKLTAKSVDLTEASARSSTTARRMSPRQSSAPKCRSARLQIYRGRLSVLPDLRVEVDLLTLIERREPGPLDSRDVHEYVGASVRGGDEPIALRAVEPFHGAGHHSTILLDGRLWRTGIA